MNQKQHRIAQITRCPDCHGKLIYNDTTTCLKCGKKKDYKGIPMLLRTDSPIWSWYDPNNTKIPKTGVKHKIKRIYEKIKPVARVWTNSSKLAISTLLENIATDNNTVIIIGSGNGPTFRKLLRPYKDIIRVGLPTRREVDVFGDLCDLPIKDNSAEMVMSSSVLEHIYDTEKGVKEMHRVLKKGGIVYAEIPFQRAYHMIPNDYVRYTASGIQGLFERNGFSTIDVGISSGPVNGLILFLVDFTCSVFSFNLYLREATALIMTLLLHPFKYLDRLFEHSEWAKICACNFYYVGRKVE